MSGMCLELCEDCKWHRDGLCMNEKSDCRIDWTDDDFKCEKWEATDE